ncbi:MAG: HD-GYP domain-containing protein [Proteobacteria bacterium]|nr:HD-GYP domain-containing protein [Pseudomonadota bacterium]
MNKQNKQLKKVATDDLRIGMFVKDVGRSWLTHPWATKSKLVTSQRDIDQLREHGITEVIVDEAKSVTPKQVSQEIEQSRPEPEEAPRKIQDIERRKKPRPEVRPDTASMEEELPRARQAYERALEVTRSLIMDVRAGRKINVEQVQENVDQMIDSVFRNRDAMVAILKLKTYDEYTFTHSINVATLAVAAARDLGFERERLMALGVGGIFHDVGKTGIPSIILNKPDRLTDEEFDVIKRHPAIGHELMTAYGQLSPAALEVVRHHHERLDGTGYPDGLSGQKVNAYIIVSGMADIYDALSSDRVYHKGRPPHEALKILFSLRGKHFPESWVDRFIQSIGIYPVGTTVRMNTDEIGVVVSVNHANTLRPKVRLVLSPSGQPVTRVKIIDLNQADGISEREIVKIVDPGPLRLNPAQYIEGPQG